MANTGEKYNDKTADNLESFQTSAVQFPNPKDVKVFPGYGADAEDLERGFCKPEMQELPAYDLEAYKMRYSQPADSYIDPTGDNDSMRDFEFRNKARETKGLLTRPRIPTER